MGENKFSVFIGGNIAAKEMSLTDALVFIEALFNKYYKDVGMEITLKSHNPTSYANGL